MAGYSIINHQSKDILYADYTGMSTEETLQLMDDATEFALKEGRPLLRLSNMTGVFGVSAVIDRAKESGKKTEHLTIKRAVVGVTGAKKLLFNAFNRFTGNRAKAFDTVGEAKDWLVSG